jgi:DNA polymerase III epsilon subunit-like protein
MFIFLDTETTGNGLDDRLCQIAFKPENGPAVCELFNPGKPISIDAKAHDALGDIKVLEALFGRLHAKFQENDKLMDPVQEMIHISRNPVLIARMPYGKHKGMLFSEVPRDYLEWLSGTDLEEDMAYSVKYHLGMLPVEN